MYSRIQADSVIHINEEGNRQSEPKNEIQVYSKIQTDCVIHINEEEREKTNKQQQQQKTRDNQGRRSMCGQGTDWLVIHFNEEKRQRKKESRKETQVYSRVQTDSVMHFNEEGERH